MLGRIGIEFLLIVFLLLKLKRKQSTLKATSKSLRKTGGYGCLNERYASLKGLI